MGLTCKKEASPTISEQLKVTKQLLEKSNQRLEIAEKKIITLYKHALEDLNDLEINDREKNILLEYKDKPTQFLEAFIFFLA
jgi:hypothetical protein